MKRWIAAPLCLTLSVSAFVLAVTTNKAAGTSPGHNGLIALSYNAGQGTIWRIATVRPDGSGPRQLTHANSQIMDSNPTFSPDGTKIAFVRDDEHGGVDATENVMVMAADGSGLRQVTNFPFGFTISPTFTPSGSILFVRSVSARSPYLELWSVDADGSHAQVLIHKSGVQKLNGFYDLAPSPDGTTLAYSQGGGVHGPDGSIYAMGMDGSNVHRLTSGFAPDYSPDGQHILFERNAHLRVGNLAIWTMNIDGSGQRRVIAYPYLPPVASSAHYSPDGRYIVFERSGPFKAFTEVYVVHPDGSGLRRVTHTKRERAVGLDPVWQPLPN